MCFDGLARLANAEGTHRDGRFRQVVAAVRRAIVGAIMERSPRDCWSEESYARLITLKNVEFWRALYAAIDADGTSPLEPFLARYYALAQKLNDVQDVDDDERRGQPNLIAIQRSGEGVEPHLAHDYLELGGMLETLGPLERLIAAAKLHESLDEAHRLGLFRGEADRPAVPPAEPAPPLNLQWYSTIGEIVERAGPDALEEVGCAVCGGAGRTLLFEKQGFPYYRCTGCRHIYVSPRLRAGIAERLGDELDPIDQRSDLLEVQKYYAAPICHLLKTRAPGSRLLDIGFGRGHLLQLAAAFGFEVYGVDRSPALIDDLQPLLGKRLHQAGLDGSDLPWGSFDVIVMSHVLEHLEDPGAMLRKAARALNPEGVLYVAVPDMDSIQFKIFGRKWDVVTPLVHFQYLTEASLARLLTDAGFVSVERVQHVQLPQEIVPRWIRVIRRLGGNDGGELAMLAATPAALPPEFGTPSAGGFGRTS